MTTKKNNNAVKQKGSRFISALNITYAVVLGIVWGMNCLGAERWWLSCLNLYLPQWGWAIPGVFLLLLSLVKARRQIWAPVLCLLFVAGPLMGFCWPLGTNSVLAKGEKRFRIMTYNVKYLRGDSNALFSNIQQANPDILVCQDAGGLVNGPLGKQLEGYNVHAINQYIVASHYPITDVDVRIITVDPKNRRDVLRCTVDIGGTPVTLYDVHLLTPRQGLNSVKYSAEEGIPDLQANANTRLAQAELVANYVAKEHGPLILCGDLNAPVNSLVCRTLFGVGLKDAFSDAGKGYGYTYGHNLRPHHSYMRIDHIMYNSTFRAVNCHVGNSLGSDHRPVIADIIMRPRQ